MNTYRPLNVLHAGKQTNIRKGFKVLCLACGLLMYLVVLINNYQSNLKYSRFNLEKNGKSENSYSGVYNHNTNEGNSNSYDND